MLKNFFAIVLLVLFAQPLAAKDLPDFTALVEKQGAAVVNVSTSQTVQNSQGVPPIPGLPEGARGGHEQWVVGGHERARRPGQAAVDVGHHGGLVAILIGHRIFEEDLIGVDERQLFGVVPGADRKPVGPVVA